MTNQQPTGSLLKTGGVFIDRTQAESAQQALIGLGIPADRLSIEVQAIDPNPPLAKSQGVASAKGGALAGGLFGGSISLLLSIGSANFPGNSPLAFGNSNTVAIVALLAIAAGTLAGGLIGLLVGSNVPSESEDRTRAAQRYLLLVQLPAEDLDRVRDLVRQQGGEIQI